LVGVNFTLSDGVPALGAVEEVVHAKVPATEAVPPESVDEARVSPKMIAPGVGQTEIVGAAWFTVCVIALDVAAL
jgi:hypothetical protein